ncbi:hypothetical protein ACMFMG_006565 [Clarireedia jacksonii]
MSANANFLMSSTASASTSNIDANTMAFTPSTPMTGTGSDDVSTSNTVGPAPAPAPLLDIVLDNDINQDVNLGSKNGVTTVAVPIPDNGSTQSADAASENSGAVLDNGTTQSPDSGPHNLSNNGTNTNDTEVNHILKSVSDAVSAAHPSLGCNANDYFQEGLESLGSTKPPEWLAEMVEQQMKTIALSYPELHYHIQIQTSLIQKMWLTIQRNGQAFKGLSMETTRVCKEVEKKRRAIELLKADIIILKSELGDQDKAQRSRVQELTIKHDEQRNTQERAMMRLKLEIAQLTEQAQKADERARDEVRARMNRVKILEEKIQRRVDDVQAAEEREQEIQQLKERNRQLEEELEQFRVWTQQSQLQEGEKPTQCSRQLKKECKEHLSRR